MTSSALQCSIDELELTTERAMRGVVWTVSVHTGATSPHQDLIRAPALHLLPVLEVLPAALVGRPHLGALVVALAAGHQVCCSLTVLVDSRVTLTLQDQTVSVLPEEGLHGEDDDAAPTSSYLQSMGSPKSELKVWQVS